MTFTPNWASPLNDTISRLMTCSDLSIDELAARLEWPEESLLDILEGREALSVELATSFSKEFGSTPEFWKARSEQYFESTERLEKDRNRDNEPGWGATFPAQSMRKLGWIPNGSRGRQLTKDILRFFGCNSIAEWRHRYSTGIGEVAFRTSFAYETDELATLAWLRAGEMYAKELTVSDFSHEQFCRIIGSLKKYCVYKHPRVFFGKLQNSCAKVGVRLVSSKAPKGCRASGASWISDDGKPVILVSFRHLSEDHFWFTFFHEAAHVVLHDPAHIDVDGADPSPLADTEHEKQADNFAENTLVPPELKEELISSLPTKNFVRRIARMAQVTPGIVVGQLQKKGILQPNQLNYLKRRYRWGADNKIPDLR